MTRTSPCQATDSDLIGAWWLASGPRMQGCWLARGRRSPSAHLRLEVLQAAMPALCYNLEAWAAMLKTRISSKMDTLGIEPRACRMLSGCDTITPCAHLTFASGFGCCLLCWSWGLNWLPSPSELSLVAQHTFLIFEFRRMQFGQ